MPDIFDRITIEDIFDRVDLPVEQKVAFSDEMANLVRDEIRKEIEKIPIGKLITRLLAKEAQKVNRSTASLKGEIKKEVSETAADLKKTIEKIKEEEEKEIKKLKDKYADLRNEILASREVYTFGGFSPQVNDLNIGDPGTDGGWRIVKSGTALSFQRLESGTWTEKFAVQA